MSKVIGPIIGVALVLFAGPIGASIGWSLIIGGALTLVSQALVGKPRARQLGHDIEYAGTVEPRRIIYGLQKVSGMNVIPAWTSGTRNQFLHQVLAIAGHEVNDITDVYFGLDVIDDTDIGAINSTLASGKVSSGTYQDKAWIRRYFGTTAQVSDYILYSSFGAEWTTAHQGKEVAYLALQYELDEEVYKTGKPDVSCMVQGKKCYDPRLDVAPGASPTNTSYIAYTTNPALCLTDYLISASLGLGEVTTRIDWDLVVAAASICDELVTIPGSTTQKRYTCNLTTYVAVTDEERRENIKLLVGAMMGHAVFRTGKWRMYAGAATASFFELTEDDLVGKFTIRTETPSNEKYNYVRGQFVDKDRAYQLAEFEPRSDAAYETEDGDQLPREVIFAACDNQYEAQRDALIVLKRSRRKKQLSGSFSMGTFKIRPWDVGTVTFAEMGWDAQPVRCTSWTFNPVGTIDASFIEEDSNDWDDPAVGDYGSPTVAGAPVIGPYVPPEPIDFTAQPQVDGIRFHYNYPAGIQPGVRAIIYEATLGAAFSTAVAVSPNFLGNIWIVTKADATVRSYWIKLQNLQGGTLSDEVGPISAGALAITTGFHANISASTVFKKLVGVASGTSSTVTVTPVNGTPAFTYAWTHVSGDASIVPTATTSATTAFSNSGMTDGESNVAYKRCTVTGGGTATVDVRVTFLREDGL